MINLQVGDSTPNAAAAVEECLFVVPIQDLFNIENLCRWKSPTALPALPVEPI